MDWWLNSLCEIFPFPIIIGIFIWIFSTCLFSAFLLLIFILLKQSSSSFAELVPIKELSNNEIHGKSLFSCNSLSLISYQTTRNGTDDPISSFYLKENRFIKSLPSIKLLPIKANGNKQINTLPKLSTRRSIIRDLYSASNSFKENKIQQSIDSLFSKDSLVE